MGFSFCDVLKIVSNDQGMTQNFWPGKQNNISKKLLGITLFDVSSRDDRKFDSEPVPWLDEQ